VHSLPYSPSAKDYGALVIEEDSILGVEAHCSSKYSALNVAANFS
jgi:hypothetical protein